MIIYKQFSFLGLADIEKVDTTDGVRIFLLNHDIIHLRPSGNSPELRCYSESDTLNKAKELTVSMLNRIKNDFR